MYICTSAAWCLVSQMSHGLFLDSGLLLGVVCMSSSRDIKKKYFLDYWTVQLHFPFAVQLTYKRTMVILDYLHPLFAMFSIQP